MAYVDGEPACTKPQVRPRTPNWLVFLLLVAIAVNELQRTWAQAEAHRQRAELAISIAELSRKVDWLLLMQPPTSSALPLRPGPRPSPSAAH